MKKTVSLALSVTVLVAIIAVVLVDHYRIAHKQSSAHDFTSCAAAGFPVTASYPSTCTAGGHTYVQSNTPPVQFPTGH